MRAVTIWSNYGPYHLARVRALEDVGFDVVAFSHCLTHPDYPYFGAKHVKHEVINACDFESVQPLQSFWRTLRLLSAYRPELVLACGYERPETLAAVVYCRLNRFDRTMRPRTMLMVENQRRDRPRSLVKEFVKRAYLRSFDGFLAGGNTHIEYLLSLGVAPSRIRTGYDCVDNDLIRSLATRAREKPDPHGSNMDYFLTIGRLVPKKNIACVVTAYSIYLNRLAANEQPWRLLICGGGPLRDQLSEQIHLLNLAASADLVGRVDDFHHVIRLLALSRAVILASAFSEQWGLVVNEAMAAEKPVLVSKACGCAQHLVVDGTNGFTFDPNSPDQLAEAMLWIHEHQSQLSEMGKESWRIIENYSPKRFAENVRELIKAQILRTSGEGQSIQT